MILINNRCMRCSVHPVVENGYDSNMMHYIKNIKLHPLYSSYKQFVSICILEMKSYWNHCEYHSWNITRISHNMNIISYQWTCTVLLSNGIIDLLWEASFHFSMIFHYLDIDYFIPFLWFSLYQLITITIIMIRL